jgi:hypothetical protein
MRRHVAPTSYDGFQVDDILYRRFWRKSLSAVARRDGSRWFCVYNLYNLIIALSHWKREEKL